MMMEPERLYGKTCSGRPSNGLRLKRRAVILRFRTAALLPANTKGASSRQSLSRNTNDLAGTRLIAIHRDELLDAFAILDLTGVDISL
jgi:hypothetical protein